MLPEPAVVKDQFRAPSKRVGCAKIGAECAQAVEASGEPFVRHLRTPHFLSATGASDGPKQLPHPPCEPQPYQARSNTSRAQTGVYVILIFARQIGFGNKTVANGACACHGFLSGDQPFVACSIRVVILGPDRSAPILHRGKTRRVSIVMLPPLDGSSAIRTI